MKTVHVITKGEKSVSIIRKVKDGTNRVFFYPLTSDGKRLSSTLFARKYDAERLAKYYLSL